MPERLGFEVQLDAPYQAAIDRARAALKAEGFGVLTTIDVKATLKEKLNEEFRPYVILGACNPVLAHRALNHSAEVGLMLPCNVTVEALPEGGSIVRIGDPTVLMKVGNLDSDPVVREIADEAHARLERVAAALAQA
ncbi:MAG: DUF302 domain-containing protein [Gemmatimonadales bacterium]|jgi:uncharacterized protein (DUF302 family)|nr:MAG: DUF302 domain-containing protein [Gemmatimonadales bacterium]